MRQAGDRGGVRWHGQTMSIPDTGCVVDCSNSDELATLVAEWLTDLPRLERMGVAARAWAVDRFDWPALTRQAQDLFSRCAAVAKGPRAAHVPKVGVAENG